MSVLFKDTNGKISDVTGTSIVSKKENNLLIQENDGLYVSPFLIEEWHSDDGKFHYEKYANGKLVQYGSTVERMNHVPYPIPFVKLYSCTLTYDQDGGRAWMIHYRTKDILTHIDYISGNEATWWDFPSAMCAFSYYAIGTWK